MTCLGNSLLFEVYLNDAHITLFCVCVCFSQNYHVTTGNPIISPVGFILQDFFDKQHLGMEGEAKEVLLPSQEESHMYTESQLSLVLASPGGDSARYNHSPQ